MEWNYLKSVDSNKNNISNIISKNNLITDKNVQHFINLLDRINIDILDTHDSIMLIDSDLTSLAINVINKPVNKNTYRLLHLKHEQKYICNDKIALVGFTLITLGLITLCMCKKSTR